MSTVPEDNFNKENTTGLSSEKGSKPRQHRKFQVQKSANLGLIMPEGLQLAVQEIVGPSEEVDLRQAYFTNETQWTDVLTLLPPPIDLFKASEETGQIGIPQGALPVARLSPLGWQGYSSLKCDLELIGAPEKITDDVSTPSLVQRKWTLNRHGWSRTYSLVEATKADVEDSSKDGQKYLWKGSTKVLDAVADKAPTCKGNFKLEAQDGKVLLAAWKQRRDTDLLGSITVFEEACNLLPIETIITSCLCVVLAERVSGMNWVGGLGK